MDGIHITTLPRLEVEDDEITDPTCTVIKGEIKEANTSPATFTI